MKAMILAAGFGKRLGELTKRKPKPLLEVKGKPLIDYHIEKLIFAGFKTIAINTCLLYTSPSPRDSMTSRMPSSA